MTRPSVRGLLPVLAAAAALLAPQGAQAQRWPGAYDDPGYGYDAPPPTPYGRRYDAPPPYEAPAPAYARGYAAPPPPGYARGYDAPPAPPPGWYRAEYGPRGYRPAPRRARCGSGSGGTILGAIAGGLLGNGVAGRGDRAAGTILGAGVGALAGREIDRGC